MVITSARTPHQAITAQAAPVVKTARTTRLPRPEHHYERCCVVETRRQGAAA